MRESKSDFSLEPKEKVLWEKKGILNGFWNATCITNRNIYLKRRDDIKKIPYKKTTGMLYIRYWRRGYLYLYQSKFPAYEIVVKKRSTLSRIIMEELVRERSSLRPKIQRKEIRKLEKELYSEIQDELDFYKVGPFKSFLSLFLKKWFKRTEFSVLTEKGLRKLERKLGHHQRRISGDYKFWGRGSWYDPVFIFKDWILSIQKNSPTLIPKSEIYFWYLNAYYVCYKGSSSSKTNCVKKYANLKLCTRLGQYDFEVDLEFLLKRIFYKVCRSWFSLSREQHWWLSKVGKLFSCN